MDITTTVKNADPWRAQLEELQKKVEEKKIEKIDLPGSSAVDMPTLYVHKSNLLEVLLYLKTTPGLGYEFLSDITATDEMPDLVRFYLVYHLFSHQSRLRIRIKTKLSEGERAPSMVPVWAGANWAEREIYDMFGIEFEGHPDLRRILMDTRWVGHPLRKDYPLRAYQIFPTAEPIDPKLLE
jgi:NADH/F420H2 dehydrogenase subunit C